MTTSSARERLVAIAEPDLAEHEAGIGAVGVVAGARQRPLVHLHDEIQERDEQAELEPAAPANRSAAAQGQHHRNRRAQQQRVGNHGEFFDEVVRRAQARVAAQPGLGHLQVLLVSGDAVARRVATFSR